MATSKLWHKLKYTLLYSWWNNLNHITEEYVNYKKVALVVVVVVNKVIEQSFPLDAGRFGSKRGRYVQFKHSPG